MWFAKSQRHAKPFTNMVMFTTTGVTDFCGPLPDEETETQQRN